MKKTYAVMDMAPGATEQTKIKAESYEVALESFCGEAPKHRPFYNSRGLRMYHIGGKTIGITLADHGRRR